MLEHIMGQLCSLECLLEIVKFELRSSSLNGVGVIFGEALERFSAVRLT